MFSYLNILWPQVILYFWSFSFLSGLVPPYSFSPFIKDFHLVLLFFGTIGSFGLLIITQAFHQLLDMLLNSSSTT